MTPYEAIDERERKICSACDLPQCDERDWFCGLQKLKRRERYDKRMNVGTARREYFREFKRRQQCEK